MAIYDGSSIWSYQSLSKWATTLDNAHPSASGATIHESSNFHGAHTSSAFATGQFKMDVAKQGASLIGSDHMLVVKLWWVFWMEERDQNDAKKMPNDTKSH